jgi:peroxiredoxin
MYKLLLVFFLLSIASSGHAERLLDPMPQTMVAQDFTLTNVKGDKLSLSDYRGSFVLVNFWATSCLACRAELTIIQDLQDQLSKDYEFKVLAVHAGPYSPTLADVLKLNPVSYAVVTDENLQLGHWGIPQLPTTYIITPEGNFAYRAVGARVWNAPDMVDYLRLFMDSHNQEDTSSPISAEDAN